MRGLTGSEIVVLLAFKQKQKMSFEEIDTLLKEPTSEPSKTTAHWVTLLEDKRLIVREPSVPVFHLTKMGEEKAQEILRVIEPLVPVAIALL